MRVSLQEVVQLSDALLVHGTGGLRGYVFDDGMELLIGIWLCNEIGLLSTMSISRSDALSSIVARC